MQGTCVPNAWLIIIYKFRNQESFRKVTETVPNMGYSGGVALACPMELSNTGCGDMESSDELRLAYLTLLRQYLVTTKC